MNGKPTLRKCLRPPWRLVWPGSASSNYKGGWKNVQLQRLDGNYVEQQLMRPDVDRGKLWDANPSHGRRARVGKDIWLRCDSHLGSTIFNSSCKEFWDVLQIPPLNLFKTSLVFVEHGYITWMVPVVEGFEEFDAPEAPVAIEGATVSSLQIQMKWNRGKKKGI